MPNSNAIESLGRTIRRAFLIWMLPRLPELSEHEWDAVLKRIRETEFDTIEWLGVMAGVVFITYFLRFDPEIAATISPVMRYLVQFVAAFPLLVLIVGPFYLRRLRRGLDLELEQRPGRCDHKGDNE